MTFMDIVYLLGLICIGLALDKFWQKDRSLLQSAVGILLTGLLIFLVIIFYIHVFLKDNL